MNHNNDRRHRPTVRQDGNRPEVRHPLPPPSLPEPTRIADPQKPSLSGSDVLYSIFCPLIDSIETGTADR